MVTIPNSLKNKANKKVLSFLRKYSVLLKKLDPALAASYRKEALPIEGQWAKQLRLALEQYARIPELDGWQDFIQLILDLKFHDLYKQISEAGLVCYKEEIRIKKPKIPLYQSLNNLVNIVKYTSYKINSMDRGREKNEKMLELVVQLNNLYSYIMRHPEILEEKSVILFLRGAIKDIKGVNYSCIMALEKIHHEINKKELANKIQTPITSNSKKKPRVERGRGEHNSSGPFGLNHINESTTGSRVEPYPGSDELRKQSKDERDLYWIVSDDPRMVYGVTYSKPGRESTAAIQIPEGQFDVRPQDTEPLQREGNDADGFEGIEGLSVKTTE